MRHDENLHTIMMIPTVKLTASSSASAQTYGSASTTKGIVDTQGFDRARIRVLKWTGNSVKQTVRIGFQSGRSTLFVSATPLSGTTSGIIMNGVTTSAIQTLYDINLAQYAGRKRFLNAKLTNSTVSGYGTVICDLVRGEQSPPATTGFTTITRYAG
jgi:hypothetical protein